MSEQPPVGLLLCDDMIFTSRIVGTAAGLGLSVRPARSADALVQFAHEQRPRCVIVDLSNPGLHIADLMRRLGEIGSPRPFVVAYGSHVDTATLQAGREAGCDIVWPRSRFVEELARALPVWLSDTGSS